MILRHLYMRSAVVGATCVLLSGCASSGGRRGMPAWVYRPTAIEKEYPRRKNFVGLGVCGGAGTMDVMSRKQAESMAVADIASVVEVQINDTIEDHDTSVERNGRLLEQSVRIQTTRRVVTGMLSGVEIKEIFFDERTLNWHALAVLNRARAGAGAAEAVAQRLERGRGVLAGLGRGPVQDLVALRGLDRMTTELDRLAVALAIFAPSRKDEAKRAIKLFKKDVAAQRDTAQAGAAVRITMRSHSAKRIPASLRAAASKALRSAGFTVVDSNAAGELKIQVEVETSTQVGSMRIYEVAAGASYALVEKGKIVLEGKLAAGPTSSSRSSSEELSRTRSLDRLAARLEAGVAAMLNEEEKPVDE
ncbi:MAG: hypothetical protein QGH42_07145 [Kiritimatiellia bacterium]|nr:hypothetical protein [Kiritimatiellia bacterium]MDP6811495.1 hypothetical protein [Kiritimatiellia bacterium]MDP7024000.1 hypothetical protein [Kiritimatiellia bacterium]